MTLTESIILNDSPELTRLMEESLKIYDQALFYLRQSYFNFVKTKEKGQFLSYYRLYDLVKETEAFRESCLDYQGKQNAIRQASTAWMAWVKALHAWQKNPAGFKKKPRIPGYLHRRKQFSKVQLDSTRLRSKGCEENEFRIPKTDFKVKLPAYISRDKIKCIEITKWYSKTKISIIYEREVVRKTSSERLTRCGVDLGLSNLVAITADDQSLSWVVKGGKVKSINQFYNKQMAKAKEDLMKCNKKSGSKRTQRLNEKRANILKTYFHQVSARVIKECMEHGIDEVVVGHNKDWKTNVNLGKKTNQKFVQIPFDMLISDLKYKAELNGIGFKTVEESYTSKVDHLFKEEMSHLEERSGQRVKRRLFRSGYKGKVLNADINGAIGILRKANELTDGQILLLRDRGDVVSPEVLII